MIAGDGASTVAFEFQLGFEGVVDRLDDLSQWFEEWLCGMGFLTLAGRAYGVISALVRCLGALPE